MARFLTADLGAESGRVMVAEVMAGGARGVGGRISLSEVHRFATSSGRMNGKLQWNLLGLWEEIKTGLRRAAGGGTFDGVGVDTWGVDFGLLDERGEVMGNPVCYRDGRTDGVMEKVFEIVPRQRVFEGTGIQFMQLNTLYQLVALTRSGWSGLGQARRLLFMPDLLHYLLSGVAANELTIASTSQALNPRTRSWDRELLRTLGLPEQWFGELVPPGTRLGTLTADVAKETGLGAGTPVIAPGGHDTASAVAAVPVSEELMARGGWCYLSSGTWSLMGVEVDEPVIDERSLKANFTNELGVGGGGGARTKVRLLKNIMGLWLVQETRRDLMRRGAEYDYGQLAQLAAEAETGGEVRTVLDTWHGPFGQPGDFLAKIEAYAGKTGQPVPATPGQFVRACLDSLALSYRLVVEKLEELTGKRIETIHIVGGGTKNQLLNQLTADATKRRVITGPVEATALGNAMTQAMATGVVGSLAEARRIIAGSFEVQTYEPKSTAGFDRAYPKFLELATG